MFDSRDRPQTSFSCGVFNVLSPDDFDFLDEQLGSLRGAAEDVESLLQDLWTRMLSDDIPWGAGQEISGEFCSRLRDLEANIQAIENALRKRFPDPHAQD